MRIATPTSRDTSLAPRRPRVRGWLLVAVGCLLFAQMARPVESQSAGLVAAYSFDEGSGTSFADASGHGNQGTVSGATWVDGRVGGALQFDGIDDLATVADAASLDLTSGMTLEAWVFPEAATAPGTVLVKERAGGLVYGLHSAKDSGRPTGEIETINDRQQVRGATELSLGTWTHVAVTYDGSVLRFYLNGAEARTRGANGSIVPSGDPLRLGGHGRDGGYFRGRIDDLRIYNRAMSSEEIQVDMNTPVPPPLALPDGTAPVTAITSPAEGTTLAGAVTVSASASDDRGVAGVQFLLDGAPLGAEDTSSPYAVAWDTTGTTNTAHVLSARARDAAGNTGLAVEVTVTVSNPPELIITAPLPGSQISGSVVNVTYTTSGDLTGVDHVHFGLDGNADVMDTTFDGVYAFTGVPAGEHVLNGYLVRGDHSKIPGTDAVPVSFTTVVPDTTPPVVSITAPAPGSSLTGTVAVTAEAVDDVAVAHVQFLIDGASLGAPDAAAPYAVSWSSSSVPNGSHTLSAVAYDAAGNQSAPHAIAVSVTNTDPAAEQGQWSPAMNWPLVAVHASLLHTGEVLVWDAWEPQAAAKLWNPATNTFTSVPVQSGLFCAAHSHLADGRLLVVGGHTPNGGGIPEVHVFDPLARTWSRTPDMSFPRWYPSSTTLGDGRVFALSGTILGTTWADTPEIYDPSANTWSTVPEINTSDMQDTEYPLSFLLPDGRIAAVTVSLGKVRLIDPVRLSYVDPGSEPRLLLSSVAMYRPGRLLATGGGDPRTSSSAQTTASVIDFNQPSPAWRPIAPMAFPRYDHNLVVLADGSVLAVGGATDLSQTSATGTLPAELFDPVTETWQTMASMRDRRIYHSTALLLPDGRVLAAGGGRLSPATDFFTAEIFSPPYLFKGARPVITSAPTTIPQNGTIVVGTLEAADIATVALIRLGSVTHTLDMDQRYLELTFTAGAESLAVEGPGNPSLAPPGYYMLVIKNSLGVPSVASIVRVPAPSEDTVPPSAPANLSAVGAVGTATLNWDAAVDNQSVAAYTIHRSALPGFTLSDATVAGRTSALTFIDSGIAGTYFYKVTAEDPAGNTGLPSNEASATITADTTPPAVVVTAPAAGATLSGAAVLTAAASDDVGVAGVQFLVDGVPVEGEDTTAPYSVTWNTAAVVNGAHVVSARARDAAGNQATSAEIAVTVSNTVSPDLVAAYGFNEGSGTTVFDASSSNNTGSVTDAAWTTAGRFGGALSFNGVSSWVTVPDAASLDLTSALTVEAWVNPTALSGWRSALIKETGGGLAYALYANDNTPNPAFTVNISGDHSAVGTSPLPLDTWSHLAATYDGGQLQLYVNGVLVGGRSQTGSITVSTGALRIGGNAVWGEFFSGLIDEVRIYKRALSAAEIQADMNAAIR